MPVMDQKKKKKKAVVVVVPAKHASNNADCTYITYILLYYYCVSLQHFYFDYIFIVTKIEAW